MLYFDALLLYNSTPNSKLLHASFKTQNLIESKPWRIFQWADRHILQWTVFQCALIAHCDIKSDEQYEENFCVSSVTPDLPSTHSY